MIKLTIETTTEANNPVKNGLYPSLTNPFKLTCNPTAAITMTMINFAKSLLNA